MNTAGPGTSDSPKPRTRLPRGSLSREQILHAAYRLLKAEGFQRLSMARLASEFGASSMSLYRHIRGRDELLDALAQMALDEIYRRRPKTPLDAPWDEWVKAEMRVNRKMISDHPQLGELLLFRDPAQFGPDIAHRLEGRLQRLVKAGFASDSAVRFWMLVRTYTWGFSVWEAARATEHARSWRTTLVLLEPSEYPVVTAATGALVDTIGDRQFELGLDLLISGARSQLAGSPTA